MKTRDAKLIETVGAYIEIRHANRRSDTWPGWDASAPLGKRGYWVGNHASHRYAGQSIEDARRLVEPIC